MDMFMGWGLSVKEDTECWYMTARFHPYPCRSRPNTRRAASCFGLEGGREVMWVKPQRTGERDEVRNWSTGGSLLGEFRFVNAILIQIGRGARGRING